jgi:GMP synthase-like glutamine amidotransferase
MSDRRPAQTIQELDVHLGYVQERLSELGNLMQRMATKTDIERIELAMSQMATKAEVAAEVKAIRDEVERNKPATLARQIVAICLGITVIAGALGVGLAIVRAIDRIPAQSQQVAPK